MKAWSGMDVVRLVLLGTGAAWAGAEVEDGNHLLRVCTVALRAVERPQRPQTIQDAYDEVLCVGLLSGVIGLATLNNVPLFGYCLPPDSITLGQNIRIVQLYLQTHPARLHL